MDGAEAVKDTEVDALEREGDISRAEGDFGAVAKEEEKEGEGVFDVCG